MAELLLRDRWEELWLLIDRLHLGFLHIESREKSEQRVRLENLMKEFLYLVPHDRKFNCAQTAEVLRRSVGTKDNFSGKSAARAWDAIAKYAANLIRQPWRKEFCEVKLYSGFYKHEVEEALVGAEQMFEAMGYRHSGHSRMTVHDILDPDLITSVSKDALLAGVECNILHHIHESLARYNISWSQILSFRENHPGTAEQAIRAITFSVLERVHQDRMRLPAYPEYYAASRTAQAVRSYPAVRYAQLVNPPMMPPQAMYHPTPPQLPHYPPQALKPQDLYPSNGYHNSCYPPHNGYPLPMMQTATYNYPVPVSTAQLIDLDPPSPHHAPHQPYYPYPMPDPLRSTDFPLTKAKDDGVGSWENWDYVYRSLETNGYRKENAAKDNVADISEKMRNVNLAATAVGSKNRSVTPPRGIESKSRTEGDGEARHRHSRNSIELEDALPKPRLNLDTPKPRIVKTINFEMEKSKVNKVMFESETPKYVEEKIKPEFESRITVPIEPTRQPSPEKSRVPSEKRHVVTLDISPSFLKEMSAAVVDLPPEDERWECVKCTYLNSSSRTACEMCSKSRARGEPKPQPCGGQECPQCTLVNEPGRNFCAACQFDLKGSPTYI